jgi:putative lipoprotein
MTSTTRLTALLALSAALAGGCTTMTNEPSTSAPAPAARVTGTFTYLQRVALPPSAVVKVQLADVSRADAPAVALGEQLIRTEGRQVPFAFSIAYDPAKIDPRFTYAVSARIEDGGKLLFISDQRHAVITHGAPTSVEIVVRPVGGPR